MRPAANAPSFSLGRGVGALAATLALVLGGLWLAGWRVAALAFPFSDLAAYFAPKYAYAAERIAAGRLPLWNPFEFCGVPFLAAVEPGVLYPPLRVVYGFLHGEAAHWTFFFLHLGLGAVATLCLMRRLGCGLWPSVLAAAWVAHPGWLVRVYDHPNIFAAVAWIPVLLLLLRGALLAPSARAAALLAGAGAMQALTSYPPASLAAAYLVALWLACSLVEARGHLGRSLAAVAVAAVGAAALAAAQVLPGAALAAVTDRTADSSGMQAALGEIATRHVRTRGVVFYALGIRELSLAGTARELWREFGPLALLGVLAPALRPSRPAAWAALAGMALATLVPLGWLFELPLYGFVRFGLEWAYIAPFAVYVLAGLGLDAALARWRPRGRWTPVVLVLVALGGATAWSWHRIPRAWLAPRPPQAPALPAAATATCAVGDPQARVFWPAGQARGSLLPGRVRSVGGYEQSLIPARIARLADETGLGNGSVPGDWADRLARHRALASRMALRCVVTSGASPALVAAGFVPASDGGARDLLYANPDALPRARMVFAARPAASADEALALLLRDEVEPRQAVIVEDEAGPPLAPCAAPDQASVAIADEAPERVRLRVDTPCAGYLVLADTYVPGWSATLDGVAAPIRPADHAFRAVRVPAGIHEVLFTYRADGVRAGFLLSALGAGLVVALGMLPAARDPLRRGRAPAAGQPPVHGASQRIPASPR